MKSIIFSTIFIQAYSIIVPSKDCFKVNTIYNRGHSIAQKTAAGPFECQEWCQLVRRCTHFSFTSASQTCFLRQGDRSEPKLGVVSGPKHCPPATLNQVQAKPVCNGSLCLGGSTSKNSGNVMVDDKPVCDDDWGLEDAAVACRQLGFPGVERATKESEFGTVSSSFSMDNVRCRGNETDLKDCYHRAVDDCDGNEAAGVVCSMAAVEIPDECKEDDQICLLGGKNGAGNVYYGGEPVCHNGWDFPDANVVCRALGYSGASNFTIRSHFGLSSTHFSLSNVDCRGDENSLAECPHDVKREGCEADTVAGVVCVGSSMERVRGVRGNLEIFLGVSFAVLVLLIVVGSAVVWKIRNRKLAYLQKTSNALPRMAFKNPIVRNPETRDMQDQPQISF
eukprot:TRINITY_DN607_c0_g1_i10.p1 TRINITY_DN607_c0_g1~~TRINITY_DN607_c0_g1_i10.p1  ORF type:complete len:410 (-),score=92.77 TRINITY_DN607_c0_g1_i10:58-1236(-)